MEYILVDKGRVSRYAITERALSERDFETLIESRFVMGSRTQMCHGLFAYLQIHCPEVAVVEYLDSLIPDTFRLFGLFHIGVDIITDVFVSLPILDNPHDLVRH